MMRIDFVRFSGCADSEANHGEYQGYSAIPLLSILTV